MSEHVDEAVATPESIVQARMKLAYDAAVNELTRQDTSLGNLRNRAAGVLTIAALITSFAAGIGLIKTDPSQGAVFPNWAAITLLGILAVIIALNVLIMWTIGSFAFGPNPKGFLLACEDPAVGPIDRKMVDRLMAAADENSKKIGRRAQLFQFAVLLLGAEVAVVLAASLSA